MHTQRTPISEVWMQLQDRKKLAKLMVIQGVSQRRLAQAAGWSSHTYMQRLIRGDVNTLAVEPAARIAKFLGVGVDDLFLVKVSNATGTNERSHRS